MPTSGRKLRGGLSSVNDDRVSGALHRAIVNIAINGHVDTLIQIIKPDGSYSDTVLILLSLKIIVLISKLFRRF